MVLTPDNGYWLASSSASGVSGDRTQPSQRNTGYWLVKIAPITSSRMTARTADTLRQEEIIKPAFTFFTAYPSPFQERVIINFLLATTQAVMLTASDSQGRKVANLFQD